MGGVNGAAGRGMNQDKVVFLYAWLFPGLFHSEPISNGFPQQECGGADPRQSALITGVKSLWFLGCWEAATFVDPQQRKQVFSSSN